MKYYDHLPQEICQWLTCLLHQWHAKTWTFCYNLTNMHHVIMKALTSGMRSRAERRKITDTAEEPAASNFWVGSRCGSFLTNISNFLPDCKTISTVTLWRQNISQVCFYSLLPQVTWNIGIHCMIHTRSAWSVNNHGKLKQPFPQLKL